MSKDKKVLLNKAMTWGGVNYAPGFNMLPEAAAKSAVKRNIGTLDAGSADDGESGGDENFKPLSFGETMKRFDETDFSDEVLGSLQFHEATVKQYKNSGMGLSAFLESLKSGGGTAETGLPENFPMRHVFAKLGDDYDSVEKIQAKSRADLIAINGIAEGSADKILAYGK